MSNILDLLKNILSARYGKDVRQSIHDAIKQCYEDGKAGSIDLTAREEIGVIEDLTTGVKDTIVKSINWLNNSLTALSNSLTNLAKRVSTNETAISDLNTNFTKLNSDKAPIVHSHVDIERIIGDDSIRRVQIDSDGIPRLWSTNDNGSTWSNDALALNSDIITRYLDATISIAANGIYFVNYVVPSGYTPISVSTTHLWFISGLAHDGYIYVHNGDQIPYENESVQFRLTFVKNNLVSPL